MTEQAVTRKSLYGFEMREPDLRRTDKKNAFEIKQLWQRSHEILGLALQGHMQKDIAKILDITEITVSSTLNSELGIKKLSKMRELRDGEYVNVSKEISRLAQKAIKTYEEIFDTDTVDLKLKKETADTVVMDIGGHRAATKIASTNLHLTATTEEIEEFKKRGIAAAKEAGMIVDITKGRKLLEPTDRSKIEQSNTENQE